MSAEQDEPPDEQEEQEQEVWERISLVSAAFSPASPVSTRELFSGRAPQLTRLMDALQQRGQHALIYGERGVGKTSIAHVVKELIGTGPNGVKCIGVYYTCNRGDDFSHIWRVLLEEIRFVVKTKGVGFRPAHVQTVISAADYLRDRDQIRPDDVRRALSLLEDSGVLLAAFVDEFDRPSDEMARSLMADSIKSLSDSSLASTIILIGVADAVGDLIREHESIGRSLVQVHMPLMSGEETSDIVRRGMAAAELDVHDEFVDGVVATSQGLPHYTHLISLHGARAAVEQNWTSVSADLLPEAIGRALEDVSQTIRETYHRATYSNRETIYKEVLLACALADKNDVGEFGSAGVRDCLNGITGRSYEIPAFSSHMSAFSSPGKDNPRGGVLVKLGTRARYDYRFVDPLMPPYVLMKGRIGGLLTGW